MSLFETDITNPYYQPVLTISKELFENLFWYPLYGEDDTRTFIQYLGRKWSTAISKKETDAIIASCGGHFWLVKEAVRELLNNKSWSLEQDPMHFRAETIYRSLLPSEQRALDMLEAHKKTFSPEERHSLDYLKKMNAVTSEGRTRLGIIAEYLRKKPDVPVVITLQDSHIVINNIAVDTLFTRKEQRMFRALVEHTGEIVSRDTLAHAIWPTDTDEHYSDWAIDQLVKRLRQKFNELGLSGDMIEAVRGKGYRFSIG